MAGIKSVKVEKLNNKIEQTSSTIGEKVKDFLVEGVMTTGINEVIDEHKNAEVENVDLNLTSNSKFIPSVDESTVSQKVLELINKYNFGDYYTADKILSASDVDDIVTVIFKNGDTFEFKVGEDGVQRLRTITLAGGTEIHCDIDEYDRERISNCINLTDDNQIKGAIYLTSNGVLTPVYWIGDISLEEFKKQLQNIEEAKNAMSDEDLEYIFQNGNFRGYYVGPADYVVHDSDNYNAYAHGGTYVYINTDSNPSYETIIHEFGHVIDFTYLGNKHYSTTVEEFNEYYQKYNDDPNFRNLVPESSGYHYEGCPNVKEFFACSYEAYIVHPQELYENCPEVYSFLYYFLNNNVRNQ